jgi:hypothetical protein
VCVIGIEKVLQNVDLSSMYMCVLGYWWATEDAQNEADDGDEKNGGTNSLVVCVGG